MSKNVLKSVEIPSFEERRLLERNLTFDDHAYEGWYPHTQDYSKIKKVIEIYAL